MTDLIILSILLSGPHHGYALKKRAALVLGKRELHNNLVYPLLKRFIRQGWVKVREAEGERGQTRQVYSLTAAGRSALIERLAEFNGTQAYSEDEFQMRVAFFSLLPADARQRILDARSAVLNKQHEHLKALQAQEELAGFNAEVVAFRARQIHAELQWIRKLSGSKPRTRT